MKPRPIPIPTVGRSLRPVVGGGDRKNSQPVPRMPAMVKGMVVKRRRSESDVMYSGPEYQPNIKSMSPPPVKMIKGKVSCFHDKPCVLSFHEEQTMAGRAKINAKPLFQLKPSVGSKTKKTKTGNTMESLAETEVTVTPNVCEAFAIKLNRYKKATPATDAAIVHGFGQTWINAAGPPAKCHPRLAATK